ncbi:hypothetical protein [Arthrobacter cavernae]|uniref:Integrase catalytic domain-containing protein n=1 Tax=Arthrobacter cavernae TaxID=2817681 RepID=A0A939HEX3_9MICC|nr:hypothetical protein [Arthrobacter cavernae]MBO1267949.1 hypothetical protein [Arthrobacter cavernae]
MSQISKRELAKQLGKSVQCDLWFPHQPLPLGPGQEGKPPVMTSTYSGFVQARMIPIRTTEDLLGGMWDLLQDAAAVLPGLLWDNGPGIGRGKLTEAASAFAGVLGTEIRLLPPRDPESKGMVERMNGFFRRGFMPDGTSWTRMTSTTSSTPGCPRPTPATHAPATAPQRT